MGLEGRVSRPGASVGQQEGNVDILPSSPRGRGHRLRSSTPLFAEANWAWVMPSPNDLPPSTLDGGYGGIQRVILNRHDKHVNIVYGDGHAAPVKLRELYTQEWHPGCKMIRGLTIPKLPKH